MLNTTPCRKKKPNIPATVILTSSPSPRRRKTRIIFDPSHSVSPSKSKKRIADLRNQKMKHLQSLQSVLSDDAIKAKALIVTQDSQLKNLQQAVLYKDNHITQMKIDQSTLKDELNQVDYHLANAKKSITEVRTSAKKNSIRNSRLLKSSKIERDMLNAKLQLLITKHSTEQFNKEEAISKCNSLEQTLCYTEEQLRNSMLHMSTKLEDMQREVDRHQQLHTLSVSTISSHTETICSLQTRIESLLTENCNLKSSIKREKNTNNKRTNRFRDRIERLEVSLANTKAMNDKTRYNNFRTWEVCKGLDMSFGTLNLKGLKILRDVESRGEKYHRGTIPSASSCQRVMYNLEHKFEETHFSFRHRVEPFGEVCEFDFEDVLRFAFKIHDLEKYAIDPTASPVQVAITYDGAKLCGNGVNHITLGMKIVDKRARDPISKQIISSDCVGFQSVSLCYPLCTILTKETKEAIFQNFKTFYEEVSIFEEEGLKSRKPSEPSYYPISFAGTCDMKAAWVLLDRGGGAKIHSYPCCWCYVHDSELTSFKTSNDRCSRCLDLNKPVCYHIDVSDINKYDSWKREIAEMESKYTFLCIPRSSGTQSKMTLGQDEQQNNYDTTKLDFAFRSQGIHRLRVAEFAQRINHELQFRSCQIRNTDYNNINLDILDEDVLLLKNLFYIENKYKNLQNHVSMDDRVGDRQLMFVHQVIPDIMHMSNRTAEKIINMIIRNGALEASTLVSGQSIQQSLQKYKDEVENVMNSQAFLGDENDNTPTQLRRRITLPLPERENEIIGQFSLSNYTAIKFIERIHLLLPICVRNAEKRTPWKETLDTYLSFMADLGKKNDFTDLEIDAVQDKIDHFCYLYLHKLELEREGMTNYIHILAAGHLKYYLHLYRNLYRYSQQGWEHFNKKFKCIFLRRTQRFGNGSNGRSYIKDVYRALMREMAWKSGFGDEYFKSLLPQ